MLLRTEPFTLCEGRTATLRLYGRQDGEYDCGVSRILLLWDDGGEQELRTADVGDDVWCTDGYTNCWTEDGGLAIGDYNFDGYMDTRSADRHARLQPALLLLVLRRGDRQLSALWQLGRYQLEIDAENEVCICQWHATPEYYTDTYRPDGEGGLYLARRDTEVYYSADGVKSFTEVYAVNEQPLAYADLDRDGANEILVLTSSEPDEFAMRFYTLDAKKYDGTALFTEEFGTYHVGWNTLFLVYGEGRDGVWGADDSCAISPTQARALLTTAMTCSRSPTLRARRSRVAPSSSRLPTTPDTSSVDRSPQEDFERFREDVGNLLRGNVTLLFSTDPVVCADLAYPMDGSYTEQAVENILSDLDAQALWLYPADAKGA